MAAKKQLRKEPVKQPKPLKAPSAGELIRHLFLAWLLSAFFEYIFLPEPLLGMDHLAGIAAMSMPMLLIMTGVFTLGLWLLSCRYSIAFWERISIAAVFLLLAAAAFYNIDRDILIILCAIVLGIMVVYGFWGHKATVNTPAKPQKAHWIFILLVALLAAGFITIVSAWSINRLRTYWAPAFDFGIFAQMFHNMKQTGLPITTVERGAALSHFAIHVSPIYYLILPFYCLFPYNATLQIAQVVILASAVIPMWLIGKQHGLGGLSRLFLCALVLFYPTTSGGVYYDLHENCFLLPLILWLMYAIDRKSICLTALFAVLTLMVKEDAAVYVAVAALYLIIHSAVNFQKDQKKPLFIGIGTLLLSIAWFLMTTNYLAKHGDGVMTYRYQNFMYDDSGSLFSVIKAVLLCPMKMLYECTDPEKLDYIAQTMFPLLGLPLITRKTERYILLIPYILLNLMSDYQYQHNILFQYNFGSSAFLLYLVAVNVADFQFKKSHLQLLVRTLLLAISIMVSIGFFKNMILPQINDMRKLHEENEAYYEGVGQALETIPEDASVASHTFYIPPLADRAVIYDIHNYCPSDTILSCDYVVLKNNCTSHISNSDFTNVQDIITFLTENGYTLVHKYGSLVIYAKDSGT